MTKTSTTHFFGRLKARLSSEGGMTLIELLASMIIFLVVSTGIAGTMVVGLRSTADAQMATMGKAAAQDQIEDIKARPFHIPYADELEDGTKADADILDTFYPDAIFGTFADSQDWEGWYTESGGDAYFTLVSPADDRGIVTRVETRFIDNDGSVVTPPSYYNSNDYGTDFPASQLLEVTVTTTWQARDGEESYTLTSRISSSDQVLDDSELPDDPGDDPDDPGDDPVDPDDDESEADNCDAESGDSESDLPDEDSDDEGSVDGGGNPNPNDEDGDDEECDDISNDYESDETDDEDSTDNESRDIPRGGSGH